MDWPSRPAPFSTVRTGAAQSDSFLAAYGEWFQRQMSGLRQGLVIPGCIIALVLGLIFVEPDRGCAILLALVAGTILIVAGVRLRFLFPPALALLAGLGISFLHDPMRLRRIMAWIHPEENKEGAGYQAYEAMIALGSGGWCGLGLGNGRQKLAFRTSHRFYFFHHWRGIGIGGDDGRGSALHRPGDLRHLYRPADQRHLRTPARRGHHVYDRLASLHQHGRRHQFAAQQGHAAAVHQLRRLQPAAHVVAVGLLISISRFAIEPPKKKKPGFQSHARIGRCRCLKKPT